MEHSFCFRFVGAYVRARVGSQNASCESLVGAVQAVSRVLDRVSVLEVDRAEMVPLCAGLMLYIRE